MSNYNKTITSRLSTLGCLAPTIIAVMCFCAWLTHVITCLKDGEWGFLIAGALVFPVAIIHGFGIWFGWW